MEKVIKYLNMQSKIGNHDFKSLSRTCPICTGDMQFFKEEEVSKRWIIQYYSCRNCGLIHSFDHSFFRTVVYENYYFDDFDSGWKERCDEIFLVFDRHFQKKKPLKVLDIGSGKNYFVSRLLDADYDVLGIDLHSEPEYAKNRFYRNYADLPFESFDVIVLLEVMEHLISPWEEIKHFTNYLAPNGKLFLSTVVFNEGKKDSTNWYINPRFGHVTIWSMKSLSRVFLKFGFESASIYRSGNLQIWDRKPGSIINRWDFQRIINPVRSRIGRIYHKYRTKFNDLF